MITEDYVSFEVAKLLKEKGFDWCCGNSYLNEKGVILLPKPTLQMAMKWLREVHRVHIVIYPYGDYSCDNYQFDVYKDNELVVSKDDGYVTYEQACEAAIRYCLENLI